MVYGLKLSHFFVLRNNIWPNLAPPLLVKDWQNLAPPLMNSKKSRCQRLYTPPSPPPIRLTENTNLPAGRFCLLLTVCTWGYGRRYTRHCFIFAFDFFYDDPVFSCWWCWRLFLLNFIYLIFFTLFFYLPIHEHFMV